MAALPRLRNLRVSCEHQREVYITAMVRDRVFAPITAMALALALVFQTLVGCGAAHGSVPVLPTTVAASGHCDDMTAQQTGAQHADVVEPEGVPAGTDGSPVKKTHDCAKLCHPLALHATGAQMVRIALITASLDAPPLDGLSGSIVQPATPPPKNG